jgi:hypothetical protein
VTDPRQPGGLAPRSRSSTESFRRFALRLGGLLATLAALAAIGSFMVDAGIWPFDPLESNSPAIVSQEPAGQTPSPSPSLVATPTSTPATIEVPNVVGELATTATIMLEAIELEAELLETETTVAQPGIVFSQEPEPGGVAQPGDIVTLHVAFAFCDGQRVTLIAYGGQTSTGTGGDDVILAAGEGSVTINAGDGNDRVCLGSLKGKVDAGAGNDRVLGSPQADIVEGGDDNDFVDGGAGNDLIYGEDSTTVTTDRGDDELRGGEGNDILVGSRGDDTLFGGPGKDTFLGGPGDDVLEDVDPDQDSGRAGEETGDDDFCPGVGNIIGPALECERW